MQAQISMCHLEPRASSLVTHGVSLRVNRPAKHHRPPAPHLPEHPAGKSCCTSWSCAMSWVLTSPFVLVVPTALPTSTSQIVQVVSMLEVPMILGSACRGEGMRMRMRMRNPDLQISTATYPAHTHHPAMEREIPPQTPAAHAPLILVHAHLSRSSRKKSTARKTPMTCSDDWAMGASSN